MSLSPRCVLVTTFPFGEVDRAPFDLLKAEGIEVRTNPFGRRLREEELVEIVPGCTAMIAGTEPITARVLRAATDLAVIARVGIGLDSVDLLEARRRNVRVAYTPDAPSAAVAELTIGLMIDALRGVTAADRVIRRRRWQRTLGRRLSESTVGVIGVGRIGKRVIAHLSGGFPGVRVLANDLAPDMEFGAARGVAWVDKSTIYREAEVITLHIPLTLDTKHLIGNAELATMRSDAILINVSRGGIVDEAALAEALTGARLGGAGVDVFETEPYTGPLAEVESCVLTCHMGSMSVDCRRRMESEATMEIVRFFRDEPMRAAVPEAEYALAASR
jgi:D-3-phosphoglycerate dehydrogenase